MLQALFALAIVIAFLPMFAKKLRDRQYGRENAAIAAQIDAAFEAARAFMREEADGFRDGVKVLSGAEFADRLGPYGLPFGFQGATPLGQSISLAAGKNGKNILAVLVVGGGKVAGVRRAEILARIGFWGAVAGEDETLVGATGGWEIKELPPGMTFYEDDILVRVPEDEEFTELLPRASKNPSRYAFHTDLDMGNHNITGVGGLAANAGDMKTVSASDFVLSGVEADKKNQNNIGMLRAGSVYFSSPDGNPLTIIKSDLTTKSFAAASIANHGDAPTLTADKTTVRDFNMTAGRTGFTGPPRWTIKTDAFFTNITLSVEKLSISSFLDASRGQDVFLDESGSVVEYSSGSGVRANTIKTDNIIMRDQISSALLAGGFGASMIEIRPSGTSLLPDALISSINNDMLAIPLSAADGSGKNETCRAIIGRLGGRYNSQSLAANIICRFVMYNRIERRIEIKKCLLAGGTNCG